MTLTLFTLLAGFILLIKGADELVRGASSLAARLGVSSLLIGLTVVSLGTTAPELLVNIFAATDGQTSLAIGNILGSNLANILLILGLAAVVHPLAIARSTVTREIPIALVAVVLLGILAGDNHLTGGEAMLSRADGLVLFAFFFLFLYYLWGQARANIRDRAVALAHQMGLGDDSPHLKTSRALAAVALGLGGLIVGGRLVVTSAVSLASTFGMPEGLVGLTIVAVGTSLPELATAVMASYRKNAALAVGNAVGANILNVFWVLGFSATLQPLPFDMTQGRDLIAVLIATLALIAAIYIGKRHMIGRGEGVALIAAYLGYIALAVSIG